MRGIDNTVLRDPRCRSPAPTTRVGAPAAGDVTGRVQISQDGYKVNAGWQ
jgi:hypothetical protein